MTKKLKTTISLILVTSMLILFLTLINIRPAADQNANTSSVAYAEGTSGISSEDPSLAPIRTSGDGISSRAYGKITDSWSFSGVDFTLSVDPKDNPDWGKPDQDILILNVDSNASSGVEYKVRIISYDKNNKALQVFEEHYYVCDIVNATVSFGMPNTTRIVVKNTLIVNGESPIPLEYHFKKI